MLDKTIKSATLLGDVAMALATGRIRIVDLTQTLTPDFPQIALPPEMGQCWPFRIEEVSQYDERGPGWYWTVDLSAAESPTRQRQSAACPGAGGGLSAMGPDIPETYSRSSLGI